MASEEQCLTDQSSNKVSISEDCFQVHCDQSITTSEGDTTDPSDNFDEENTSSCILISDKTTEVVDQHESPTNALEDADLTEVSDDTECLPTMGGQQSPESCDFEDIKTTSPHAEDSFSNPETTLAEDCDCHPLGNVTPGSSPVDDSPNKEPPPPGEEVENESTVILNIPLERENFHAKNDAATCNPFISPPSSQQQQKLSPNPPESESSGSSSMSCDVLSPLGPPVGGITLEQDDTTSEAVDEAVFVSIDQVFQQSAQTFFQVSTKDEITKHNENLTVINSGNNNNNTTNNNNNVTVSFTENSIQDLNNCKEPLGLVINVFEKTEIPNVDSVAGVPWDIEEKITSFSTKVERQQISEEEEEEAEHGSEDEEENPTVAREMCELENAELIAPDETLRECLEDCAGDSPLQENLESLEHFGEKGSHPEGELPGLCQDILNFETEQSHVVLGSISSLASVEAEATPKPLQEAPAEDGRPPAKAGRFTEAKMVVTTGQPRPKPLPTVPEADREALEPEERRTSLLALGGALPTISEKAPPGEDEEEEEEEEDKPDEEFKLGFEFNLENSPMLRNSRRRNQDRRRKDCRQLFALAASGCLLEESSGASEEEEEASGGEELFRSLRDSLDIAKHVQLAPDPALKDDLLNHNEPPPTPDDAVAHVRRVPPYAGTSMSLKKKTSLKGEKQGTRRVSFPEDDARLITGYLEPFNPWNHMGEASTEAIAQAYRDSCARHKTRALPIILQQIVALPLGLGDRIECLSFRNHRLESGQCECLEEIFRRVQFRTLDFEACEMDDDTAVPLFDMVEFYDSALQLNVSANGKIASRGWQACARMLKKTPSLQVLEARATNLSEQNMPIVCKALRQGSRLHTLHLENCNLTGRPLVNLVGALRLNEAVTDLYLADNRLGTSDCIQLGNLLRANRTLRLLDLRNNNIQDAGCTHICRDIAEQQGAEREKTLLTQETPAGLATLVLWNNHITVHAMPAFSLMLTANAALETLNLGRNSLTGEGVLLLKSALIRNRSLRRLGLQATRVGDEGAIALAECIADNPLLARLDLRENCIRVAGLMALCHSLRINRSVVQLDLDAGPRPDQQHAAFLHEIKALCQRNLTEARPEGLQPEPAPVDQRKISLTCETVFQPIEAAEGAPHGPGEGGRRYRSPAPSPSVSPCPSPSPSPVKTRFRVSRVAEGGAFSSSSAPASFMHPAMGGSLPSLAPAPPGGARRFTVTKVSESFLPQTSRAMSSPSLASGGPTIVVSSPNKAVRGFSVDAAPQRAPLAAAEPGSLDSDSEDGEDPSGGGGPRFTTAWDAQSPAQGDQRATPPSTQPS